MDMQQGHADNLASCGSWGSTYQLQPGGQGSIASAAAPLRAGAAPAAEPGCASESADKPATHQAFMTQATTSFPSQCRTPSPQRGVLARMTLGERVQAAAHLRRAPVADLLSPSTSPPSSSGPSGPSCLSGARSLGFPDQAPDLCILRRTASISQQQASVQDFVPENYTESLQRQATSSTSAHFHDMPLTSQTPDAPSLESCAIYCPISPVPGPCPMSTGPTPAVDGRASHQQQLGASPAFCHVSKQDTWNFPLALLHRSMC